MNKLLWSPLDALSFGMDFLGKNGSRSEAQLMSALSVIIRSLDQDQANNHDRNICEFLFNLYEHVFTSSSNYSRLQNLSRLGGQRILDWGCGSGFFAINLALQGRFVSCVDINPVCLEFISKVAERFNITDKIQTCGPITGYFSGIICLNVLDHLANPSSLIQELDGYMENLSKLFVFAHFSGEGSHTGKSEVPELIRTLTKRMQFDFENVVPLMDIWEKNGNSKVLWMEGPLTAEQKDSAYLIAFPKTNVTYSKNDSFTVESDSFLLVPTKLSGMAWDIYSAIRKGDLSLSETGSRRVRANDLDYWACIEELRRRNLLLMRRAI